MPTIDIEDDVFAELQRHARPFVDTPSTTLRRLLGMETGPKRTASPRVSQTTAEIPEDLEALLRESMEGRRTKAPKADLRVLARGGMLKDGEKLFLVDYQGNRVPQQEAVVSGALLTYKGEHFTMSNLAQELLKKVGFKSKAVRGPSHWANAKGVTVTEMWQQWMERQRAK